MIFISRIFCFRDIREVLNSRASICVVDHIPGLKQGMQIVIFYREKVVVHRISVHFWCVDFNWHSNVICLFQHTLKITGSLVLI